MRRTGKKRARRVGDDDELAKVTGTSGRDGTGVGGFGLNKQT